jgi:hypothetical protein
MPGAVDVRYFAVQPSGIERLDHSCQLRVVGGGELTAPVEIQNGPDRSGRRLLQEACEPDVLGTEDVRVELEGLGRGR